MKCLDIFFIFILLSFKGCTGFVMCYTCEGYSDSNCSHSQLTPQITSMIVNCSGSCYKAAKYHHNQIYEIRQCQDTVQSDGCVRERDTTCYCSYDYCNGVHTARVLASTAISIALLHILWW